MFLYSQRHPNEGCNSAALPTSIPPPRSIGRSACPERNLSEEKRSQRSRSQRSSKIFNPSPLSFNARDALPDLSSAIHTFVVRTSRTFAHSNTSKIPVPLHHEGLLHRPHFRLLMVRGVHRKLVEILAME